MFVDLDPVTLNGSGTFIPTEKASVLFLRPEPEAFPASLFCELNVRQVNPVSISSNFVRN